MRDFRDAKAMAHALRGALKERSIEASHSETLELVARAFGCASWNVLSARIEAAHPGDAHAPSPGAGQPAAPTTLYCTFCGKSQHDVRTLIAGPSSYICDECVELCNDIIDTKGDQSIFALMASDEDGGRQAYPAASAHLGGQSAEDVVAFVERSRRAAQRYRLALRSIQEVLAMREGAAPNADGLAAPRFSRWKDMSREELVAHRQRVEGEVKRYEQALRLGVTALGARALITPP
jgi:hypothetical protein